MEIFISELPKNCEECSLHRSGCLKLKKGARYIDAETCVLGNFYKFQEIDNEIDTCPLKPLSDRLAEERKKAVQEVKQKLCMKDIRKQIFNEVLLIIDKKFNCCGYVEEKFEDIKKYVLDQIEKGEK